MLNRDAILNAQDFRTEAQKVPEWGGEVFLRTLTCNQAENYQEFLVNLQGDNGKLRLAGMRVKLLTMCLCDQSGVLLFSDEDMEALAQKDSAVIGRLFEAAKKLNAIDDDAGEEAEKN